MTADQISHLSNNDHADMTTKTNIIDYKIKVPDMIKKLFSCKKCLAGEYCEEHNNLNKDRENKDP